MDRLSDGLPWDSGGAVIVTSRRLEVAQQMVGADNLIIPVKPMDKQNCWCILMDAILRDDHQGVYNYTNDIKDNNHDFDPSREEKFSEQAPAKALNRIKDQIEEEFQGLPFAAKVLATAFPGHIRTRDAGRFPIEFEFA
ncbi:hypothetical protein RchiOBHm_Chr2g0152231 [Rosa chinensis]|uniref:P-loop containing nucleoside triphosphate hydrolase n=1 Tax=Rosa chinensis TaxID=74649 RepID=A0A2P6S0D1_ROSCH|nr:hypothetical protein RchiOBHm_Chr2g0152231 [Rosa chinensis]